MALLFVRSNLLRSQAHNETPYIFGRLCTNSFFSLRSGRKHKARALASGTKAKKNCEPMKCAALYRRSLMLAPAPQGKKGTKFRKEYDRAWQQVVCHRQLSTG